ncbi:hypothetical protein GCM10007890_48880 [Methylobacterium tardum]|uniref:Uncharacterized protein n=1 Tax=Methylobacterium tardum TaxID=374432 RepID=A0AA37TRA7_9HYPH|nr:hypothetical protein GCM10007890_48880 [Methylobacterium tardum]
MIELTSRGRVDISAAAGPAHLDREATWIGMHDGEYGSMRRLLDEAVGREFHAEALVDLAVCRPGDIHVPTLCVLVRSQRIRAMELRGNAAALLRPRGVGGIPVMAEGRPSLAGQATLGQLPRSLGRSRLGCRG